ncbi:MAG: hypothetical protein Q9208_006246 [Pyrenodesmia sp. 3 TL-2023]
MTSAIKPSAENSTDPNPVWRPLTADDIPNLLLVACKIHPSLPESGHVFAERVKLFSAGCLGLFSSAASSASGELQGYTISHPILRRQPPPLDTLLGDIPPDADQYYIHDLALLPEVRGRGLAQECIDRLMDVATKGYGTTSLVSVYGTERFWGRWRFEAVEVGEGLREKVMGYGEDAVFLERKNGG